MTDAPRCPKCGDAPPVRKVEDTLGVDRITYRCPCGEVYLLHVGQLKDDDRLTESIDAA